MYKRLFVFVEGVDDERFFNSVVVPLIENKGICTQIIKYSHYGKGWIDRFVDGIPDTGFIVIGDLDDSPNEKAAKERLISNKDIRKLDESKIHIVVHEIESWFLAGYDHDKGKKCGLHLSIPSSTDTLCKEDFLKMIPGDSCKFDMQTKLISCFSLHVACARNESLNRFIDVVHNL